VKDPQDVERELAETLAKHAGEQVNEATARLIATDIASKLAGELEQIALEGEHVPHDDWAFDIVVAAAWHHQLNCAGCAGWAMTSAGRAWCGKCGWALSGRMEDAGQTRSGAFALCALGRIGQAFQVAQDFSIAYAQYRYGDQIENVRIDGKGGIVGWVRAKALHSVSFVHKVDV
jgi:hypothetical protein